MKNIPKSVGANVTLGLLGVLLVGIEIGKNAHAGDTAGAYTLAIAAISSLASGNVGDVLRMVEPITRALFKKRGDSANTSEPE